MAVREHYSNEVLTSSTFTSNVTWGTGATLSPTLANGADYIVFWNVEMTNQSNTTADAMARVTVGGTAVASFNVENRNTSEWAAYSGFFKVTGTGSPLTIAWEIKAETNGNNIVARTRRLTVLRMGSGDIFVESTARQAITTGGTTSFADIVSTSFTPDAGDYLVLGHSMTDNYATTTSVYGKFSFDGVAEGNTEVAAAGHPDITAGQKNLVPLNKQRVYSVASGGVSRTVQWLGRSHQNGMEAGFSQNRLLILKLADFAAYHSAWLPELGWVEGTTPTNVLAISPTLTANPHLLLGSWYNNNVSSSSSYTGSILDDADDDQDAASSNLRSFNTGDTRGFGSGFAGLRTYAAGVRPISIKAYASGVGEWASTMPSSAFTVLDLGADDEETPVIEGALATDTKKPSGALSGTSSKVAGLSVTGTRPVASLGGSVAKVGALSASTKRPTPALAGTVRKQASLITDTKRPTSALSGETKHVASLATLTKPVTSGLIGVVTAPDVASATLAATTKKPSGSLSGLAAKLGVLNASTKRPASSLAGQGVARASLTTLTRKPTSGLTGIVATTASLQTSTKRPTPTISASVKTSAMLGAVTKRPVSDLVGSSAKQGSMGGVTKRPTSSFLARTVERASLSGATNKPSGTLSGVVAHQASLGAFTGKPAASLSGLRIGHVGLFETGTKKPHGDLTGFIVPSDIHGALSASTKRPTAPLTGAVMAPGCPTDRVVVFEREVRTVRFERERRTVVFDAETRTVRFRR